MTIGRCIRRTRCGPWGCSAPEETPVAAVQTSRRRRINSRGAIGLETGETRMLDVTTVDAVRTSEPILG